MDQTQLVASVGSDIWEVGDVVVNKLHFIHFHFIAMHFLNFSDTRLKITHKIAFATYLYAGDGQCKMKRLQMHDRPQTGL